jgi:influenza virus NS1A-binding protein
VGSSEIHAHRIVLASASPYLHELFAADDENKSAARENVITYRLNGGIDKAAFERLIDFAYTSRSVAVSHFSHVSHDVTQLTNERAFLIRAIAWCVCRLHVPASQVKSVYLAACQLKMDKVIQVCSQYLIQHLDVKNCIEIRSLPGICKNKQLVAKVDRYVSKQVQLLFLLHNNCHSQI